MKGRGLASATYTDLVGDAEMHKEVKSIMALLSQTSKTVQRRQGFANHETERVKHAFGLLQTELDNSHANTSVQRQRYYALLKQVRTESGNRMIVLCAGGFGKSVIGDLSTGVRLDLAARIKEAKGVLSSELLENIVVECSEYG